MSQARDRAILESAGRDKRICITLDADFHAILAVTNALGPSVIRIRREGLRGDELAALLTEIWPRIEVQAEQGAMITITKHDIRVRRLPILQDAEGS